MVLSVNAAAAARSKNVRSRTVVATSFKAAPALKALEPK
jgi:hypothetical protein